MNTDLEGKNPIQATPRASVVAGGQRSHLRSTARKFSFVACVLCAVILAGGCATSGKPDPLERLNRDFYKLNSDLDVVILKPATDLYEQVVPEPIRQGIHNGFANLGYANVILNDLLQGDLGRGWENVARMAINSTIGIGGIFDVATEWGLPAHHNDFGITLGKWGLEPGPYLFLPLLGPSSGRDAMGYGTVVASNPLFWLAPPLAVTVPLGAVRAVDARSNLNAGLMLRDEAAIDPYIFTRDAYLQYRQYLIKGEPVEVDEDFYDDDFFDEDLYDEKWDSLDPEGGKADREGGH